MQRCNVRAKGPARTHRAEVAILLRVWEYVFPVNLGEGKAERRGC